ncbi:MAG: prepilin-type N-terminal cleavage/methylation domain-containing protein [Candidatus Poribacteria bacterium]|nr:prepilin-type N-terminal cleavage/methylation domain-containing protein [Candidatus Poribacteria bacterium]
MLTRSARNESGMTLLELLIAVAIVVLLAGLGIPIYLKFQASSKASEANTTLNGIKMFQQNYKWATGTYIDCPVSPRPVADLATFGHNAVTWTDLGGATGGFTQIGFSLSADVRFCYEVNNASKTGFVAGALGNTNSDGKQILYIATANKGPHIVGADAGDAFIPILPFGAALTDTGD